MTRDEAFHNRPMLQCIAEAHKIDRFISQIFYELELQVCANCIHNTPMGCYELIFGGEPTQVHPNFGCNKFTKEN